MANANVIKVSLNTMIFREISLACTSMQIEYNILREFNQRFLNENLILITY